MNDADHVEIYDRYLVNQLGRNYPINPYLESLLLDLLTDSRGDVGYLGMQSMVESLALATLEYIYQTTNEPVLRVFPAARGYGIVAAGRRRPSGPPP